MKWKSQGERNAGGGEKYAGRLWEPAWYLYVFLSWFLLYGAIQEGFPKKRSGRHRYLREPLTRHKKSGRRQRKRQNLRQSRHESRWTKHCRSILICRDRSRGIRGLTGQESGERAIWMGAPLAGLAVDCAVWQIFILL